MSSKRKTRHAEWLKREAKRKEKKESEALFERAKRLGNMELMAQAMGIKLR